MSESWSELAIIVLIIVGIAAAIWRGGQANPESTGQLGRKLVKLEGDVRGVRSEVKTLGGKVDTIERQVTDIDRQSAKGSDIERLERQITEQGRHIAELTIHLAQQSELLAKVGEAGDQRGKQLDRLYDFIVERGMSK